jgi:hypothetical protein
VKQKLLTLAAAWFATLAVGCGGGSSSMTPPPLPVASERFFVENFSGNVSGFSAATGKLEPIPGSSAMFPTALTKFAVKPDGTFLAVITETPQLVELSVVRKSFLC